MAALTIVLVDDHQVVREGLRALLETQEDFCVIGEASGGLDAVQLVEKLKPDILILDLMMQDMNGIEVTRQVLKRSSGTGVVILSMHSDEAYVIEALQAGAQAYVLKESSSADLATAVRSAARRRRYLSPSLSERAIEVYAQRAEESSFDPYETLTVREREVLHMAAQGFTNAQIASRLYITLRTVETHRMKLMRKLGLHTHTDLIRYAVKKKILPLDG